MHEQVMERHKYWVVRFDIGGHKYDYAYDINRGAGRRMWSTTRSVEDAAHFRSVKDARTALTNKYWAVEGYCKSNGVRTEIVEITETLMKTWKEGLIVSDENALIQLARLVEDDDEDDGDN